MRLSIAVVFFFIILAVIMAVTGIMYFLMQSPSKNLNMTTFPPCYEISPTARQVYMILAARKGLQRYNSLINAYSIFLCVQSNCNKGNMSKGLHELKKLGGDIEHINTKPLMNAIVRANDDMTKTFIYYMCNICEANVTNIAKDNIFDIASKLQLKGLISQFYRTHFDPFVSTCQK